MDRRSFLTTSAVTLTAATLANATDDKKAAPPSNDVTVAVERCCSCPHKNEQVSLFAAGGIAGVKAS